MDKNTKKALWIGGIVVGGAALIGVTYAMSKPAAAAVLPPASTASTNPSTATVNLAAGAMTTAVSPGGSVTLALPSGASWATSNAVTAGVTALSTQPSGSAAFTTTMGTTAGQFPLTANWTDSTGASQTTTITVTVG